MKSICLKTNNLTIQNYLLKELNNINLPNTYISMYNFKHFNNIIIHHINLDNTSFVTFITNCITKSIINFYEKEIILDNLNLNYFYFNRSEKNDILKIVLTQLNEKDSYISRYDLINNSVYSIINNKHSFYFQGFINFGLKDYNNFINTQIDIAVNQFLINKEYNEFVNLLRTYLISEECNSKIDHIHLIYKNDFSVLVDSNNKIIKYNDIENKAKYVSDISFSQNDLILNTLLNLIPKKITIHTENSSIDEFIQTLILIFQNKISICDNCELCQNYEIKNIKL